MIVDDLQRREAPGDSIELSARLRWTGREERLRLTLPSELAAPAGDASPFLPLPLLLAMRVHEDLEIDGAVSPRLLGASEEVQRIYHGWDLSLRPAAIRVAAERAPAVSGSRAGCFFSRGVDSMYSAARARGADERLDVLLFCRDMDPVQDERVQAQEAELARSAAARLRLPLAICTAKLRPISDPVINWDEGHGAGLATLGLAAGGGLRRLDFPSWGDSESLGPAGSHPALDPLFSTEAVEIRHDLMRNRVEKVGWLATNRPELLPDLKVCFVENRPDNCGRCRKCIWTMACLRVHGALEAADAFPDEIDVARVRSLRLSSRRLRILWLQTLRALPADDPLRDAIGRALRRSARPTLRERLRGRRAWRSAHASGDFHLLPPPWDNGPSGFARQDTNQAVELLWRGRPYP